MANFDMTGLAESLPPSAIKKEEGENSEENTELNTEEVDTKKPVGGKAYTVAGERSTIEGIIRNCGSEIIGGFHETIDGGGGICYIRMPKAESEQKTMLKEFNDKNILVWREKQVNQSTNGYKLDLANEEHLKFAKAKKDIIIFSGSKEIENNIKENEFPTEIFYKFPNGCYCMPGDDPVAVGTPNMCAMGVKIDTVKDTNIKNNQQISKELLNKILDHHHEKTVIPKQKSKGIKTEKK